MPSILIIVLLLKIAPMFLSGYFTLEDAYNICRMSDFLVIILLSWFAYLTVPKQKYFMKVVSMLSLIASVYFMFNYVFVDAESTLESFELIGS